CPPPTVTTFAPKPSSQSNGVSAK
ncbi:hypothetical protein AVDCRST_MAG94-3071, partial [uncultured Leptolyngbya sp.]